MSERMPESPRADELVDAVGLEDVLVRRVGQKRAPDGVAARAALSAGAGGARAVDQGEDLGARRAEGGRERRPPECLGAPDIRGTDRVVGVGEQRLGEGDDERAIVERGGEGGLGFHRDGAGLGERLVGLELDRLAA
jgi:hypothetical protein